MMPKESTGWPPPSAEPVRDPQEAARGGGVARAGPGTAGGGLPQWESFSPHDRRLLVGRLIHTARRRVQHGSPGRVGAQQG